MASGSTFNFAQVRLQSRYGQRADERVWLSLYNTLDLASYLHTAQQTPLRSWLLGIDAEHTVHEVELALRQKYRNHVDEVAGWLPAEWQPSFHWIKYLHDLPVLRYLLDGGRPQRWMKTDPALSNFIADDVNERMQAMRRSGCGCLVTAWQQGNPMLLAWLDQWEKLWPGNNDHEVGMRRLTRYLRARLLKGKQSYYQGVDIGNSVVGEDSEALTADMAVMFRRYAFQPAAVGAYLAIIASDLLRIRSDLMQRLLFPGTVSLNGEGLAEVGLQ